MLAIERDIKSHRKFQPINLQMRHKQNRETNSNSYIFDGIAFRLLARTNTHYPRKILFSTRESYEARRVAQLLYSLTNAVMMLPFKTLRPFFLYTTFP